MKIDTFQLERTQSLWEHTVEYNLTETGVHPLNLNEVLTPLQLRELLDTRIGYGHTNGSVELRQAISTLYPGAAVDNVLVTNGSAEANFIAMWSLLEPGDEIVLMFPNYMQIWGLARALGAEVNPFRLQESRRWHVELDELSGAISSRTKLIAVCNPNNPTGAVLTADEMQEIVRLAAGANAWIYADEVYRGAELNGDETPTFYGLYEKTLVCCGLSKAYALPGLRIGWLVGPQQIVAHAWAYHDYTTIAPGILSDRIAAIVLQSELRQKVLERNREILQQNAKTLNHWVANRRQTFSLIPPDAGGLAFLRYELPLNSTDLSTKLREEQSVFVVAGDCFGMDGFLRIGIGADSTYFREGLQRIDDFLQTVNDS